MNYYSHNIGDYAQATMHLSLVEDAIYTRLLRRYYAEESPIVNDMQKVCRWVGARTEEERQAVEDVLDEFFVLDDGYWHNKRADAEIAAYQAKSSKASESAAKRWHNKKDAEEMPKQCERNANAMPSHTEGNANQEPRTNNQETEKQKTKQKTSAAARPASLSVADLVAYGVDENVAAEFLAVRKRKRSLLTPLALEGIKREADGIGWTLDQTLRKCVERGWQGFEAAWVAEHGHTGRQPTNADRNADWNARMSQVIADATEPKRQPMKDMGVIDAIS
jgi:uncharacterized protein YdaU (DUF1376 family)